MNHRISRLCGGFPVFLPGHVAQHGIHILLKDTRCIQSEDHCGPILQSSAMTEAAAATAAQLAAVVLAVTFALSVADRLLKRWKVGPRRSRIASRSPAHRHVQRGWLAPASTVGPPVSLPASKTAHHDMPQVPDTRRQQFELQQEVAHLQRQAAALNHPDTFAQVKSSAACLLQPPAPA
jgi:hypothetical protein